MTVKDLFDMVKQYQLDPNSELMVRPLLKDKSRKVNNISTGEKGCITLMCNRTSEPKNRRR